jgi:hypothetical protein
MSINSLANSAAARRTDIGPASAPKGMAGIAAAASTSPENAPTEPKEANNISTAMNVLFGYIPTEVVTLYVAIISALQPPTTTAPDPTSAIDKTWHSPEWITFFLFVVFTPVAVWLAYAAKVRAANKPFPSTFGSLPLWEMLAALIAFCAWAFALPESPFRDFKNWYSSGLGGIAVLVASTVLGLLAPFFQSPLNGGSDRPAG